MKTQTAVNWLYDCMPTDLLENDYIQEIFKEAKKKEKKQIIECVKDSTKDCWTSLSEYLNMPSMEFTEEDLKNQEIEANEYYNEKFKNQ